MHITLQWSLRQSRAEAGLVGLLEQGETGQALHVMASQGLPALETNSPQSTRADGAAHPQLKVTSPDVLEVLQNGKPGMVLPENALLVEQDVVFESGMKLLVVPIMRQQAAIGLLALASKQADAFPQELVAFLDRLSDHAAIALSNAQLYADLQAANNAKTEFISLVSHELKTPMTAIRGYTDLLAQGAVGAVNEAQASFLGTIRANVNRMSTLVSDLADVSRIESNRLRLEYSAIPVAEAVQEVARTTQAQIEAKSQTLALDLPADLPAVWADPNRVIQILNNLISNANKYSPAEARVTVRARREHNRWDEKGAPQVVHVSVADTGFGISAEDQEKIFQKFFRAEDQNIRESPGTGLGLNITRHLVEMQGGKIWFESELGKGTTFHFTIPVAAA
jgi:signal transduction histidine kinase